MEIRIGSYVAASFLLEQEPNQWHALIVLDSGKQATEFVKAHARSFCYLRFDDVEEPRANKETPNKAMIEQGLNFAKWKRRMCGIGLMNGGVAVPIFGWPITTMKWRGSLTRWWRRGRRTGFAVHESWADNPGPRYQPEALTVLEK